MISSTKTTHVEMIPNTVTVISVVLVMTVELVVLVILEVMLVVVLPIALAVVLPIGVRAPVCAGAVIDTFGKVLTVGM